MMTTRMTWVDWEDQVSLEDNLAWPVQPHLQQDKPNGEAVWPQDSRHMESKFPSLLIFPSLTVTSCQG